MGRIGTLLEKILFSRIRGKRVLRYALYLFLSLLAQTMVLNRVRILGVCPLVLPAVAVALGMFHGASWGAILSLVMGVFADMAFVENTVTFTLLFPLLAFGSGFLSQFYINRRFFAFMGEGLAALLLTGLVQLLLVVAKDSFSFSMLATLALQTLWSFPLAALAYLPPSRWRNE